MTVVKKAAAIGGGVIGAGWVARLIETGIHVAVYDPAPGAEHRLQAVLGHAARAYGKLTLEPRRAKGAPSFQPSIPPAVADASLLSTRVPAWPAVKRDVIPGGAQLDVPTALND